MNNGSGVRRLKSRIVRGFKATLRKCFWNGFKAWKRQLGRGGPLPTAYGLNNICSDPGARAGLSVIQQAILTCEVCGEAAARDAGAGASKSWRLLSQDNACVGRSSTSWRPRLCPRWRQTTAIAHSAGGPQECGSHIFYDNEDSPSIDVYVGTLDHPEQVEPDYHLFCCKGIIPVNEAVQKYNENGPKE
ncbi:hypothetical protein WJX74_007953 [Apatococcus lobatus]|uniref:Uncharacterized protein n=1 Tax=Apatococcus lobatus TaxID=904363 RepID=A0AAW1SBI8_9CHLO